jgi:hypothetical protein
MDEKGNHLNPMLRAPTWEEKVPSEITKNEMEVLGIVTPWDSKTDLRNRESRETIDKRSKLRERDVMKLIL